MQDSVRPHHPLKTLGLLVAGACAAWILLASSVATGDADLPGPVGERLFGGPLVSMARADTDTVGLHQVDSLRAFIRTFGSDSLRALLDELGVDSVLWALVDSIAPVDTNYRAQRYLGFLWRQRRTASLFPRKRGPLSARLHNSWRHDLDLDSTQLQYIARESVAGKDIRIPVVLDAERYRAAKLETSLDRNWRDLITRRAQLRRSRRRGGLGLSITVPGGSQSGFTTIFGKNEVDLRVTGTADIRAGFNYRKSEQQATLGKPSRVDPEFKQKLRLGVTGTIGDKMQVAVDWDSERQFDFENQLKLQYTGYEDEILQSIEAGNVFLQTPSSLIRGGQSLFGIKSEFKIGGFQMTTVASQQEGQSNSLTLEGGAETTDFDLKSTEYVERTHFFLSYYFRNRWEEALSNPPTILLDAVFAGITDIEVWKLTPVSPEEQNVRQVVAMVDLGEPAEIITAADAFTEALRPESELDQYSESELATQLRPGSAVPKDYLESGAMNQPLTAVDFQVGQFKKLEAGRDYDLDELLGFITLKQVLQESEALAVSFRYLAGGREYQVGDFSSETGGGDNSQTGERIVLKLLKPVNLQQPASLGQAEELNPAAWYLEMRNVYRLGRGLRATEFVLDIGYEAPGQAASKTIPGVTGQQTLIQVLGLDRLNEDGATKPDDIFDFLPNYTVRQGDGYLMFPYLEPFGKRMEDLINAGGLSEEDKAVARERLVFADLYRKKRVNARRNTQLDVYRIEGSFKESVPSSYDLGAFSGVVEGAVRVTSGGVALTEGTDYIVDYNAGTVNIINPAFRTAGREISIQYEQNALINLQKKTLLGARLDYSTSQEFGLGATIMRLSQKSITDKFSIGEEPISNLLWGLDGQLNLEPRWLTRMIDALPLLQTKAPSAISLAVEIAQLRPGHTLTNAFKDERRDLRKIGRDFDSDEVAGQSYIDDFEGFENLFSLMRPGAWLLSSAPVLGTPAGGAGASEELDNNQRSAMGWYQLNSNTLNSFGDPTDPAVGLISPQNVFPNRQATSQQRVLTTLDLFFTPHERGPYNYNTDLGAFLDDPKSAWGGMTQRLTEGNTDFTAKNIEFVEFVFQPFPEGGDADPDARLYIDLGLISEDVIPDNKLNTEDGLSLSEGGPVGQLARLSTGQQDQVINPIRGEDRITEDLGLDGLASFPNNKFEQEGGLGTESAKFTEFLSSLDQTTSARFPDHLAREIAKARIDPSGDDYVYFLDEQFYGNSQLYPRGASIQQRFTHFFTGHELNSYEAQKKLSSATDPVGNSRNPDTEDINLNSASDTENSYFQYELPLSIAKLDELAEPTSVQDYVVEEIKRNDGKGTGWFLVRIPVKEYTRRVGGIQDFTLIESIRMWTSGHTTPITLRFATLEFVGSQWRKSDAVSQHDNEGEMLTSDDPLTGPLISISSVNNEENATYAIPNGAVRTRLREIQSGTALDAREQAMVINVQDVEPGRQQAIFRAYTSPEDLLKYRNLRMFVHLNGEINDRLMTEEDRGKLTFFMRIGSNEINDYYEYEQPLTPSPLDMLPTEEIARADYLWRTYQPDPEGGSHIDLNSVNIELGALNQLKFLRDNHLDSDGMPFPTTEVFWNDENKVLEGTVSGFAPPGTRLGIKGTPSLARVSTIVMGVRNRAEDGSVLTDVNVWVNELRVSGYDEKVGFAGLANARIDLADLASIKAQIRAQTDGFGSLESTLGERTQVNSRDWTVNTQLNVNKFIPERFGWQLPLTLEIKSSTSTPRFDPNRGDIRVSQLKEAVAADTTLSPDEISRRQAAIEEEAQSFSQTRSFTSRISKAGSRSRLVRNTLDGVSLSYSFSESKAHRPTTQFRNSWRWSSTLGYQLSVRSPRVVRPFWFLDSVPIIKILGGLRFNYLPSSFAYTMTANRNFSRSRQRPNTTRRGGNQLPLEVAFPVRPQHRFAHARQFKLQYNPFGFLNLSMDTSTNQSLNAVGADTLYAVILVDEEGLETRMDNTTLSRLIEEGVIEDSQVGKTAFEISDISTVPSGTVLKRAVQDSGPHKVRTENYDSRFTASFRPRLQQYRFLNWMQLQDISYSASFGWNNGSVGSNTGARVSSGVTIRGGMTVRPKDLFEKFGFYKKLQEQQRAADNAAEQRREQRTREREARRSAIRAERQRQRAAEAEETREEEPEDRPVAIQPEESDTTQTGPRFRLPSLPNPLHLLRRALLGLTSIQDVSLTYTRTLGSEASNVGRIDEDGNVIVNYSLRDALLRNQGPSLRYRLGLDRTISATAGRVFNDRLQVTDAFSNVNRIEGRTTLNPSNSLRIGLNWSLDRTGRETLTYRLGEDGLPLADTTRYGDQGRSVWAFGASYLDLFTSQLSQFRSDCGSACGADGTFPDTVRTTTLTNTDIFEDFNAHYLTGPSRKIAGFFVPLPSWTVTYSGAGTWPIIRWIAQSASIRHGYVADYSADFRSNLRGGEIDGFNLGGGPLIEFTIPEVEIDAVRINERFQPLIALDMSFKGSVQTSVTWNKSNTYSLSTTNNVVGETRTNEISITASYQKQGLRLPFFRRPLNNRISFSITLSRSSNSDRNYFVRRAMEAAVLNPNFDPAAALQDPYSNQLTSTVRLSAEPKISYQFSNQVTADAFLEYEQFNGDSRRLSFTSISGGFNFRLNFAQ